MISTCLFGEDGIRGKLHRYPEELSLSKIVDYRCTWKQWLGEMRADICGSRVTSAEGMPLKSGGRLSSRGLYQERLKYDRCLQ